MPQEFKYEVAFSFLSQDEQIATEINDHLQDRYQTFLYSQRQKELAGTDGEIAFSNAFAKEARTVAVLYRPEWGSTPWTRIEQTAIRDRAHEEGYDFTTFIAMNEPIAKPLWLPKTRLLYGLKRFGVAGAAAVLDARIQDQGGSATIETVAHRAERLRREKAFASEVHTFNQSGSGVTAAQKAAAMIDESLEKIAAELTAAGTTFALRKHEAGFRSVAGGHVVMVYRWEPRFVNSLDESRFLLEFCGGFPRKIPGIMVFEDPPRFERSDFQFKLVGPGRTAWVNGEDSIAPEDMAEYLAKRFMDHESRRQRERAQR